MNGATVALTFACDPVQSAKPPVSAEVERRIGAAVADAAAAIGQAMGDLESDERLTMATKTLGGHRLAKVAALQLAHFGEFDFAAVARVEGLRELHRRHDVTFQEQSRLDAATIDRGLREILDWVIGIADKVVADERRLAH
jgi:hypothetical protein